MDLVWSLWCSANFACKFNSTLFAVPIEHLTCFLIIAGITWGHSEYVKMQMQQEKKENAGNCIEIKLFSKARKTKSWQHERRQWLSDVCLYGAAYSEAFYVKTRNQIKQLWPLCSLQEAVWPGLDGMAGVYNAPAFNESKWSEAANLIGWLFE